MLLKALGWSWAEAVKLVYELSCRSDYSHGARERQFALTVVGRLYTPNAQQMLLDLRTPNSPPVDLSDFCNLVEHPSVSAGWQLWVAEVYFCEPLWTDNVLNTTQYLSDAAIALFSWQEYRGHFYFNGMLVVRTECDAMFQGVVEGPEVFWVYTCSEDAWHWSVGADAFVVLMDMFWRIYEADADDELCETVKHLLYALGNNPQRHLKMELHKIYRAIRHLHNRQLFPDDAH